MLFPRDAYQHLRLCLPRERGMDLLLAAAVRFFRRARRREWVRLLGNYTPRAALAAFRGVGSGGWFSGFNGREEGVGGGRGGAFGAETGAA